MKENKMEEKTFNFNFTEAETNLVLSALAELPFRVAQPLINKIVTVANTPPVVPAPDVV